ADEVPAHDAAADEHQHLGAQSGGFVEGAEVVVDAPQPLSLVLGREEAAAAEARDAQARGADRVRGLAHRNVGELLAPRGDPGDAGPGARLDGLEEPGPDRGRVQAQPREPGRWREERAHAAVLTP